METDPFGPSRKRLLGLAYRMLGDRTEAEDVLQDAWLRFNAARDIDNRDAMLTTIVTRLCLDRLKSARARREDYVGPWLPEPVDDTGALSPDAATELADELSFALLLTLERLSPAERAAFLLHDVFDIPFAEVAIVLGRQETACRQLAARGRKAVQRQRPALSAPQHAHRRLLSAFGMAIASGDIAALTTLLRDDAVLIADGGGKVTTALNPIRGADRIARFFAGIIRKFGKLTAQFSAEVTAINGRPGIVTRVGGRVDQVLMIDTDSVSITAVYVVRNPDKLGAIARSFVSGSERAR